MAVDEFDLDIKLGMIEEPIEVGEAFAASTTAGRCLTDGRKCD